MQKTFRRDLEALAWLKEWEPEKVVHAGLSLLDWCAGLYRQCSFTLHFMTSKLGKRWGTHKTKNICQIMKKIMKDVLMKIQVLMR